MSAEEMTVPPGEVLLDGRLMRMDGSATGVQVAGTIMRGEVGMPPLVFGRLDVESADVQADVFWFETFMERLMRDVERRATSHC